MVPLVIMVEASLITPPVGLNLYVLQGLARDYDVLEVAKSALPFFIPMLLVVMMVVPWSDIHSDEVLLLSILPKWY